MKIKAHETARTVGTFRTMLEVELTRRDVSRLTGVLEEYLSNNAVERLTKGWDDRDIGAVLMDRKNEDLLRALLSRMLRDTLAGQLRDDIEGGR